jgi:dephospho-CoA kinase
MIIFGITGTLGAGKGTVAEYLVQEKGFAHYSARELITEEVKRRGLAINRDTMTETANSLRSEHGADYVLRELYNRAKNSGQSAVIESIRTVGEVETLKKLGGILLAVDAEAPLRYERAVVRGSETDTVSYEKFVADEQREYESDDPLKQNLKKTIDTADYVLHNDGTMGELHVQIEDVLKKIGSS